MRAVQSADLRVSPGLIPGDPGKSLWKSYRKTSDKQVYSVVEEILEHKDIGESSYSGNWMERNWEKAAFSIPGAMSCSLITTAVQV